MDASAPFGHAAVGSGPGSGPGLGPLVIGVGNPHRGDDGAGLLVAERLAAAGARVQVSSGEGVDLMGRWEGEESVVLVDAASSGAEAGTIHRFDAGSTRIPAEFFHYSTHAFSVAEAVELARVLGTLPPRMIAYGIEGASYAAGAPVSEAVAKAVERVTASILEVEYA